MQDAAAVRTDTQDDYECDVSESLLLFYWNPSCTCSVAICSRELLLRGCGGVDGEMDIKTISYSDQKTMLRYGNDANLHCSVSMSGKRMTESERVEYSNFNTVFSIVQQFFFLTQGLFK